MEDGGNDETEIVFTIYLNFVLHCQVLGSLELQLGPIGLNVVLAQHDQSLPAPLDAVNNLLGDGLSNLEEHSTLGKGRLGLPASGECECST